LSLATTIAVAAVGCYGESTPAPPPRPYPPAPYGYGYPAPPPYASSQIARAESSLRESVRATPPPPAPNVFAQIDVAALAVVARMFPKGCAAFQAAPGAFVHLDCRRYAPIAGARVVNTANKLRLFQTGQLRLDPQALGTLTPPLLLTGLASLFGGGATPAPAPSSGPGQLPAAVDHRSVGTEGPIKDQQVVGSCTAFSLSTVMDNAVRRLNRADVVSAMHVWSRYADPTMESAESHNQGRPLTLWPQYPYDERVACRMESQDDGCAELLLPHVQVNTASTDPTVQAQIRGADAQGQYTITEVDQINATDPDALALELATGKDIWFALGVSQDAWTSPVVQSTGVVPDWLAEDGGHAIALAGYRVTPAGRQFLVHNSWGPTWGDGGYGWISEAMIRAHAQSAYTVAVVDRSAPPAPPTPVPTPQPNGQPSCPPGFTQASGLPLCQKPCTTAADCGAGGTCVAVLPGAGPSVCVGTNPLTDDDCGEGQLVDAVTGQCAPSCANGLRPAGGWCPFGAAAR
jgi:papain like protease